MSGRRSHPRFAVVSPWIGEIRVLRDITIERIERDELIAVSQVPGILGEEMSLNLVTSSGSVELKVRLLESRPVIVAGSIRHRLRLAVMESETRTCSAGEPVTHAARKVVEAL